MKLRSLELFDFSGYGPDRKSFINTLIANKVSLKFFDCYVLLSCMGHKIFKLTID